MQDISREIVANAARLLDDAKLLYEAKRYKSAISLAVLAAEEIGKVLILSLQHDLDSNDYQMSLSSHRDKLAALAMMVCLQMTERVEAELLQMRRLPNTPQGRRELRGWTRSMWGNNPAALEALHKATGLKPDGRVSDSFVRWFTNTYLELFGAADGLGDAVAQVGTGIANKLKQYGFYVDVSVMEATPSNEPDEENARRWIRAVEQTLDSTVMKATIEVLHRAAVSGDDEATATFRPES